MPDLLSRAITLQSSRQFAVPLQIFTRLHTRRSHGTAATSDRSLHVDSLHLTQPTGNDNGPPLRLRKHGFKSLPLSPLVRTGDASATTRRAPAPADEALKNFQKEVAMNPYAQALATPVRFCSLTLAHLPSYFLLPFATVIEQTPATDASQPPQVKARIQPGRRLDYPQQETLTQTSYTINRQDAVRHLSRKRHWTFLVLERQKAKVASLARRSASSQKMVHDLWVWENQVDAMAAFLEKKVVAEAMRASGTATSKEQDTFSEEQVPVLKFVAVDSGDFATNTPGETNPTMYDLTTLLSSEALESIAEYVAHDVTEGVWKLQGSQAWRVRLAIDKLKRYKESNEIQKQLPMVQNPAGARQQRLEVIEARSSVGGGNGGCKDMSSRS